MPEKGDERTRFRALLVDYGGVLTTSVTTSFAAFCLANGVNPEQLRGLMGAAYGPGRVGDAAQPDATLISSLETGAITPEEFDRRLAAIFSQGLAEPLDSTRLSARMLAGIRPDERMIDAVRKARDHGVKTGLISNTWRLDESPSAALDLFDVRVLSGEEGIRKPDPDIYLRAAARVNVPAARCVFVDDLPSNVEGARAVGMTGVLHRDAAITIPKLEELLALQLS